MDYLIGLSLAYGDDSHEIFMIDNAEASSSLQPISWFFTYMSGQ